MKTEFHRVPVTVVALFTACVLAAPATSLAQAPPPPVIAAQGESLLRVVPDQAWATVRIETRDAKAPEARRLSAVAMTSVMAVLKRPVPADAIKTVGFSLNPDYEYVNGRQRMRGFVVSNQVQVRIDDITKVAEVLDAVGSLSLPTSSNMTVANLRFDLKNRAEVERDALRLAVEDAVASVKAMAAGAGVAVGRITRIDQVGQRNEMYAMEQQTMMRSAGGGADAAVATPISPSEIVIRAGVTVTAEIK